MLKPKKAFMIYLFCPILHPEPETEEHKEILTYCLGIDLFLSLFHLYPHLSSQGGANVAYAVLLSSVLSSQ